MKNIERDLGPTLELLETAWLEAMGDPGRERLASVYRARAAALVMAGPFDDEPTQERQP